MRFLSQPALLAAALLVSATVAASAATTGGATLAGGNNGASAKRAQTRKAVTGQMHDRGSPAARVAPGQSTEHPNGKMRGSKEF